MKGLIRYAAALLAVVLLLLSALCALAACVTTEAFAREVGGTKSLRNLQQQRIGEAAQELTERWQLTPGLMSEWTQGAADAQSEAVANWWGMLWQDEAADRAFPLWLDASREAALVALIREDPGFIAATDADQRRAIARDEVVYALDEAVCDAVTPLRRSIVELGLTLLGDAVSLPLLRQMLLLGAAMLAGAALALMIPARRMVGSILLAAALLMAGASVPVALADIPGLLAPLSGIAAMLGRNALACLGVLWYGAAAVLALLGAAVIAVKKAVGGEEG